MNRLDSASTHRAERRRAKLPYKSLFLLFALALLLVAAALPSAVAEATSIPNGQMARLADPQQVGGIHTFSLSLCRLCPPEPPPEPTVARPRAQAAGKDLNGGDLTPGDEILWTITVKNIGGVTLTEIVVTDIIPEWTSYVAGSIEGSGADDGGGSTLTWAVGTLKGGERQTLSFRSRVDDDVPVGTYIINQASTDSAQTPPSMSKEVRMEVAGSSAASSAVLSATSSPTTVPEEAADEGSSTEAPATTDAVAGEALASAGATSPSSPSTTVLEATATDSPSPVAAAAGDDRTGYQLGLGLGLGLGGLAVIGLATGLLVWRRRRALGPGSTA